MRIFLATSNPDKRTEFQRLLGSDFEVCNIAFSGVTEGSEMVENARLKAEAGYRLSKSATIGEDSGLFVTALDGAPGVFSARFGRSDQERVKRLLLLLGENKRRDAYFRAIIALVLNDKVAKIFEGRCDGHIAWSPSGEHGFGYDPIFVPNGHNRTFGELGAAVKDQISHRARAVSHLRRFLMDLGE